MQNDNICKFIPTRSIGTELTTINFVYERKNFFNDYAASHSYSINIAVDGNGILHTDRGDFKLRRGDLFFTFPQQPYYIENENNFEYIYITFIGTRANALKERLSLEPQTPVLDNHEYLIDIWQNAIAIANNKNIDLIAEGTLLYSFAYICNVYEEKNNESAEIDIILKIKKHVEENFADADLTLKSVSEKYLYNDNYISGKFRKTVKMGFNDYLQKLRMENAVHLISMGIKNVNEISRLCGYNDALYFSKVFKKNTGLSPKQFMHTVN